MLSKTRVFSLPPDADACTLLNGAVLPIIILGKLVYAVWLHNNRSWALLVVGVMLSAIKAFFRMVRYCSVFKNSGILVATLEPEYALISYFVLPALPLLVVINTTPLAPREP